MSLLSSQPNICFLRVASEFGIKYSFRIFTSKYNQQVVIFEEKLQKFAMSVVLSQ